MFIQEYYSARLVIMLLFVNIVKDKKSTIMTIIQDILKNEGIAGFFKGVGPSLILVSNPVI